MTETFAHGYALLIAVDDSEEPEWKLPDVAKDVSALQAVLVHPERCAYLPDSVKVVQGEEATRAGILDGLSWLRQKLAEDKSDNETAVVYYTGHGLRDITGREPVSYLVPYDARRDSLRLTRCGRRILLRKSRTSIQNACSCSSTAATPAAWGRRARLRVSKG